MKINFLDVGRKAFARKGIMGNSNKAEGLGKHWKI